MRDKASIYILLATMVGVALFFLVPKSNSPQSTSNRALPQPTPSTERSGLARPENVQSEQPKLSRREQLFRALEATKDHNFKPQDVRLKLGSYDDSFELTVSKDDNEHRIYISLRDLLIAKCSIEGTENCLHLQNGAEIPITPKIKKIIPARYLQKDQSQAFTRPILSAPGVAEALESPEVTEESLPSEPQAEAEAGAEVDADALASEEPAEAESPPPLKNRY